MSNESSWSTDLEIIGRISAIPSGWGPEPRTPRSRALNPGYPREWHFRKIVETKVIGYDENSYFKLFPDVHEHLGEVQSLRHPGVGHWPQGVPGNDFLAILLKHKLLGMMKIVISSCFWMSMMDVHKHLCKVQSLIQPGVEHWPLGVPGINFWQFCVNKSC